MAGLAGTPAGENRQTRKGETSKLDERLTPKTIIKPGQFSMEIPGQFSAEIDTFGVPMLRHEPFHLVAPAPFARLPDDDERRLAHVAQSHRAAARRGRSVPSQIRAKYAGYRRRRAKAQVDLAVTLQSPSEKAASTASGGGGAGNPPGLAQTKNLLVHFQRLWA
jgi:hypothetical protein